MIEKLYTVEEVADLASVTGRTIRNYLKSGRLVGRKIGGQWRFPESEVQRLLSGPSSDELPPVLETEAASPAAPTAATPPPSYAAAPAEINVTAPAAAETPYSAPPAGNAAGYTSHPQPAPLPRPEQPVTPAPEAAPAYLHYTPPAPAAEEVTAYEPPAPVSVAPPVASPVVPEAPAQPAPAQPRAVSPIQRPLYHTSPDAARAGTASAGYAQPPHSYVETPAPEPVAASNPYTPPQEPSYSVPQPVAYTPPARPEAPVAAPPATPEYSQPQPMYARPEPAPVAENIAPPPAYTPPAAAYEPPPAAYEPPARPAPQPAAKAAQANPYPEFSEVGKRVAQFVAEVHDCAQGPQICAVIDLNQSLPTAKSTSARLIDIARQESDAGEIACECLVEFDERYFIARYTLFGSSAYLQRCLHILG